MSKYNQFNRIIMVHLPKISSQLLTLTVLVTTLSFTGTPSQVWGKSDFNKNSSQWVAQLIWQPFRSEAGKFSVALPESPKSKTVTQTLNGQPIEHHIFEVEKSGEEGFLVAYVDLPSTYVEGTTEVILDKLMQEMVGVPVSAQLQDHQQAISLQGNPGRELRLDGQGRFLGMRLYLVGQRLYLLLSQSKQSTDIDQFLSSFQLIES